jgi:predicted amidophosphoribosyltransferase
MDFTCIDCGGDLPMALVTDSRCTYCLFGFDLDNGLMCSLCDSEDDVDSESAICAVCQETLDAMVEAQAPLYGSEKDA